MTRQPKPRKKTVGTADVWYTKAGGDTSFGNIKEMSCREAM